MRLNARGRQGATSPWPLAPGPWLLCIALAFAASCAPRPLSLPTGPTRPVADAEALLRESIGHCDTVTSLTAEIGLSGNAGGQRLRGRLLAGFGPDDAVRLEAVAPFGAPYFLLAGRGGTATLFFPREGQVLRGAPAEEILEALAGLDVKPSELRAWLAGCPASQGAIDGLRAYGDEWAAGDMADGRTAWFRRTSEAWHLVAITTPDLTIELAEHQGPQPGRVRLRRAASADRARLDIRLALSQVETNVELPEAAFTLDVPRDAVEITLDDLRASGPLRGTR